MWREIHPSESDFEVYGAGLCIDGFDYEHPIHVWLEGPVEVTLYHNEGESDNSDCYWGFYFSDGDGECYDKNLDEAKQYALKLLTYKKKKYISCAS